MNNAFVTELAYLSDCSSLFLRLRVLGGAVWLDSARPHGQLGNWDILTAEPIELVRAHSANNRGNYHDDTIFTTLQQTLSTRLPATKAPSELPFVAGAIGYFSYGTRSSQSPANSPAHRDIDIPDAIVGLFDCAVLCNHEQQQCLFVAHPQCSDDKRKRWLKILTSATPNRPLPFALHKRFVSNMSAEEYQYAFDRIQGYIRNGDCYQVNFAQRFTASCEGDPLAAYLQLRAVAAAPFSAFLELGEVAVLSLSPERFIHVKEKQVLTSPIKGTAARSTNSEEDNALAQALLSSAKDRAENLMIVDLMRNDLGRCCIPGSIQVEQLFKLESFATVHHLVSTITGELRDDCHALDVLNHCFPGGSVTGAPKRRAMEIIQELEPDQRSVYCGAIAYIDCNGGMDSSITIRTLVCADNQIYCWGGGGIVADSLWQSEYQESVGKIEKLLAALDVNSPAPLQ